MKKKTIYYHGQVYTGSLPLAEAFVVLGDCFLGAGTLEDMEKLAGDTCDRVDLKGCFVCPGFNDSHMHLLNYGDNLEKAQLAGHTSSLEEMMEYLREFEKKEAQEKGGLGERNNSWLFGWGWNQDFFRDQKRFPTRWDLDEVSTVRPICLTRACGHCCVVNSKALEVLGISKHTPDPEGGSFERDETGELSGLIREKAVEYVYSRIPKPSGSQIKGMIKKALKKLNSYGVTSCHTDDFEAFSVPYETVIQAYQDLEKSGELTVRICQQARFKERESFQKFLDAGWITGAGSPYYKIGPLKLIVDGSLGSRTAYLSCPYKDDPLAQGILLMRRKSLKEMIMLAHEKGMQIAVHAIGDGALDFVLDGYEEALRAVKSQDLRHGIVHCQITRPQQLERIIKGGFCVYAQTIFLDYDIQIVEDRVGRELASTSYAFGTLRKHGVHVSNGSDCPVEEPDVMAGIQCAVTRKNLEGTAGPFGKEEAMTVQEALDSYTKEGAFASFEEKRKGGIQSGMLADFVILSQNPFETPKESLKDISVLETYVGGRCVYQKG